MTNDEAMAEARRRFGEDAWISETRHADGYVSRSVYVLDDNKNHGPSESAARHDGTAPLWEEIFHRLPYGDGWTPMRDATPAGGYGADVTDVE